MTACMVSSPERGKPHIASVAVAVPPYALDQDFAEKFVEKSYGQVLTKRSMSLVHSMLAHPSIRRRHFAFDSPECLIDEDPDSRVERFTRWSLDLSAKAVRRALDQAGVGVGDVAGIVVNTCTGYICPGLSTYLIEELDLPRHVRAFDLVGSGCGGAIPNLQVAEALLGKPGGDAGVIVSVSVEICSATFQMDNDPSLLISNALFGDGAAAAVLWNRPSGFQMVASAGRFVPEQREAVRFVHKQGRLHNQLSAQLPGMVAKAAAAVVAEVLTSRALGVGDIACWALHTGGQKIIDAVRDEIGIPEASLWATRKVLGEYGNMSSPTVWFVMDELMESGVEPGDWCVMIGYGAGLSAHAYLLRKR